MENEEVTSQETPQEEPQDSQQEVQQRDVPLIHKLIGVFTSPGAAFTAIIRKPSWVVPFILVSIVAMISGYFTIDISIDAQKQYVELNQRTSEEQKTQQLDAIEKRKESGSKYLGLIFAPIATLIITSIGAGMYLFTGNILLGGSAGFKQVFAVAMWARLVDVPMMIVKTPLIVSKNSMDVQTSLALFMRSEFPHSFMYYFLSAFDVFAFWYMGIAAIGFAILYKFEMKKAAIVVIIPFLLAALLIGGFSSFMTKMAVGG